MRRALLIVVIALAGCGGDDDGGPSEDGEPASDTAIIVTVGDLDLDLPIAVPADIPAPSSGVFAGENELATPYRAIQIGSDYDPEALRAAVRAFGESAGANYDESLGQVLYITTVDGVEQGVYVWVRTTDVGDHSTLLEIGTVDVEG